MSIGDIALGQTFDVKFTTRQISGAPFALASGVISAYVGNSTTQITAGITLTADFDTVTGLNNVRVVATSGNGFATASDYQLVITTGTVNSVSVVGEVIAQFSIENRQSNVKFWNGTAVATPATAGIPDVNVKNIDNDSASASGTVTFPNATLASTTNITAGTITTVTTVTGLTASDVGAIKTQTDKFVFTVANEVNANARYISDDSTAAANLEAAYDGTGYIDTDNINGPRTWYLAASGGSDSNTGLIRSLPLATYAQAETNANPGDTIFLLTGTFTAISQSEPCINLVGNGIANTTVSTSGGHAVTLAAGGSVEFLTATATGTSNQGVNTTAANVTIRNCTINGAYDGIGAASTTGLLVERCTINATWDAMDLASARQFIVRDCLLTSDCTYTTSGPYGGIHFGQAQGRLENCTIRITQAAAAAKNINGFYFTGISGDADQVDVVNCDIFVTASDGGNTGRVDGITTIGLTAFHVNVWGGSITLSNAGSGTTKDVKADDSASSRVRLYGTHCDRTRFMGDVQLDSAAPDWGKIYNATTTVNLSGTSTKAVEPTAAGRTLDVTATGAAGIDWANVENPTTTLALTNTTIDLVANAVDAAALAADAVTEIAAGVSSSSNPTTLVTTTIATLASQTSFTLTAGSADNDAYNGGFAVFTDAVTSTQKAFNIVSDYTGSTKTVTLLNAPAFTIATGDTVSIVANPNSAILSAANVDKDHTWKFDSPNLVTAPNTLSELIGFIGLLSMDFSEPMPARSSIASISSASFANITGTEPTVTSSSISLDNKRANILIDASAATANTYTLSVTIVTTDSQTFVRKGRLTVA